MSVRKFTIAWNFLGGRALETMLSSNTKNL
jgi:hypothetical protein